MKDLFTEADCDMSDGLIVGDRRGISLSKRIAQLAEFDERATKASFEELDVETLSWFEFKAGAEEESARLKPLLTALIECAEALEHCECYQLYSIGAKCRRLQANKCPRCASLSRLSEVIGGE